MPADAVVKDFDVFVQALPKPVRHWSLTMLREKLIKIGVKVTRHAKSVTFQLAGVAVSRNLFAAILDRIARLALPAAAGDMTREQVKERKTWFLTEQVCAEPEIDAGKRSGWHLDLDCGRVRSRKTGKELPRA